MKIRRKDAEIDVYRFGNAQGLLIAIEKDMAAQLKNPFHGPIT